MADAHCLSLRYAFHIADMDDPSNGDDDEGCWSPCVGDGAVESKPASTSLLFLLHSARRRKSVSSQIT